MTNNAQLPRRNLPVGLDLPSYDEVGFDEWLPLFDDDFVSEECLCGSLENWAPLLLDFGGVEVRHLY